MLACCLQVYTYVYIYNIALELVAGLSKLFAALLSRFVKETITTIYKRIRS